MHPRLGPVFRRRGHQPRVIGDHQAALRRDTVGKGRQICHVGQHRVQQRPGNEGIGVAVDRQRAGSLPLQGDDQLLVRQDAGLSAQEVVVLIQGQHRHALPAGDARQRFAGPHHMHLLRLIDHQRLAYRQRAAHRHLIQPPQQRHADAVLPRDAVQRFSRPHHMDLHTYHLVPAYAASAAGRTAKGRRHPLSPTPFSL